MTCSALTFALFSVYPAVSDKIATKAQAKTIAEIQEERKANSDKIAEYERQISALENNKAQEKEYQSALYGQIAVIQENIDLLNKELDKINDDIDSAKLNIELLDQSIINQQNQIDENVELFKNRLCAMYVTGNDNLATVIVGTSSFYDMMSRVEMVNRIASYDEQLINDILAEIDEMEQSKKNLESERVVLEMKLEEQEKRKQEKAEEMDILYDKMQKTQDEIDRLAREQEVLAVDIADLESINAQLDAEEAEIYAAIERQRQAAQAAYEEEQRRLAEQAALQQQQQQQQNGGGSGGSDYQQPTYIPPAPSASGFMWPVPGFYYITSGVGPRWGRSHNGIDVGDAGIMGAAIVASKSGTVVTVSNSCSHNYAKSGSCGCGGGYGNYVVISHDGTYSTLYGHMTSASVSVGQYVSQGQVIGYVGSTGFSTGAHLHFEVRVNGYPADPESYVSP